jgi:predicted permease
MQVDKERYDVKHGSWFDEVLADIRYARRVLGRNRAFTAVAVVTLALGVGANVAIFSVVDAVLLQPLPFRDPDRLVRVFDDLRGAGAQDVGMSAPEFQDLTARSDVFDQISVAFAVGTALSGGDRVERIELLGTSPNYFELLGVGAALGRVYTHADWQPGLLDGVVISDGLWKREFGGDPRAIGRRIRLDQDAYTIVGVLPPDFRHPGRTLNGDIEIWAAAGFVAPPFPSPPVRNLRILPGAIARLKAGITLEQAQRALDATASDLQRAYPNDYPAHLGWSVRIEPIATSLTGNVRPTLVVLLAAVSFVLLMVCLNIASLLVARSSARMREFAIRRAVGASRGRLVRQVLTESLLLSLASGAVAVLVLLVGQRSFVALMPAEAPRLIEVHTDWSTAVRAITTAIATGLLFGVSPALYASATSPNRDLKEGGGRGGGGHSLRSTQSRTVLVAFQVGVSVVLLIGAGLLMRSFAVMVRQDPGILAAGLTIGQIWIPVPNDPKANRYLLGPQRAALIRELARRLGAVPGVAKVALGLSNDVPFLTSASNTLPFSFVDDATHQNTDHAADLGAVTTDYFDVLGIPLKRGRGFTPYDTEQARRVIVVNEAFVRRFSSDKEAIGRRIRLGANDVHIVGVVGNVRDDGLDVAPQPRMYASMVQTRLMEQVNATFALAVFLRTRSDAQAVQRALTQTVHEVDAELPAFGLGTMNDLMAKSMARQRVALTVMSTFGVIALLLAAVGIYGVISFVVRQRMQEFAVRFALGARTRDIVALVVKPGLALTAAGIIVGLTMALIATPLMSNLLFGVSAHDPLTFTVVPLVLGAVALAASLVPARRASRVAPSVALRFE